MSGGDKMAAVLRSAGVEIGSVGGDAYRGVLAERILANPGPLLDALAEADVLRVEWSPRIVGYEDETIVPAQRRYVTEWQADA